MRKIAVTALLGVGMVACAPAGPATLVEKEYEPQSFTAPTRKCDKKDSKDRNKCLKWKTVPAEFEPECWELEWSDGVEECVTQEQFNAVQIGAVRS